MAKDGGSRLVGVMAASTANTRGRKLDVGGAVTRHANGALEVHGSRRNGSGLIKAENIDAGEHFDAIELLDENALPCKPCRRDDENR